MQAKPTDLNPVDERLLELQNEVRKYFDWRLESDIESALDLVAKVDDFEIETWSKPWRAKTVASMAGPLLESGMSIPSSPTMAPTQRSMLASNFRLGPSSMVHNSCPRSWGRSGASGMKHGIRMTS